MSRSALVSTLARRIAAPYLFVISNADFPIQPRAAFVAMVLCGRGASRLVRSTCSIVGSSATALYPCDMRISTVWSHKSASKLLALLYSS